MDWEGRQNVMIVFQHLERRFSRTNTLNGRRWNFSTTNTLIGTRWSFSTTNALNGRRWSFSTTNTLIGRRWSLSTTNTLNGRRWSFSANAWTRAWDQQDVRCWGRGRWWRCYGSFGRNYPPNYVFAGMMRVRACVSMYACLGVNMRVCVCVCVCVYASKHLCMHMCIRIYMQCR